MKGFEKYSEIIANKAKELFTEDDLNHNKEYQEAFKNHLFGLNGPKQMGRKLTTADIFFSKIYNGFREIADSYFCLLDIEIYIGRFPLDVCFDVLYDIVTDQRGNIKYPKTMSEPLCDFGRWR